MTLTQKIIKEFEKFNIEVSYQPINEQWGALIKQGNVNIFMVDENPLVAVEKCVNQFFPLSFQLNKS